MRLDFVYLPVPDLQPALALYRDALGFDELWREGDLTVGLAIPGTETAIMVDAAGGAGGRARPDLRRRQRRRVARGPRGQFELVMPPSDIPGGRLMCFRDPGGNHVYVMDQSAG